MVDECIGQSRGEIRGRRKTFQRERNSGRKLSARGDICIGLENGSEFTTGRNIPGKVKSKDKRWRHKSMGCI